MSTTIRIPTETVELLNRAGAVLLEKGLNKLPPEVYAKMKDKIAKNTPGYVAELGAWALLFLVGDLE